MFAFVLRSLSTVGTLLGAVGLFFATDIPIWASVALWAIILASVAALAIDTRKAIKERPHKYTPNSNDIIDYMYRWLSSGGRTAIFTRDMSWADQTSDAGKLLIQKAKKKELLIFVSKATEFVALLRKHGAEVYQYPKGYAPESRFTIVDFEKHGSRIAIGLVEGQWHVIRESPLADLPLSSVLEDFVKLARLTGKLVESSDA